jgi:hypothetical protein
VPFAPLRGTSGGESFWIGHHVQLSARWSIDRQIDLRVSAVHFIAGDTIRRVGRRNVDFVAALATFKL